MRPDERRQHPRFERRDIALTILDPLDQVMDAEPVLADIGQGGAGLTTRAKILPGESIKFHLALPGGRTATGHGKVRWVNDNGPSFARDCGIEFIDFGWGGFGRLQDALDPRVRASIVDVDGSPAGRSFDGFLMISCVAVGFFLFRALLQRPDILGNLSGFLSASSAPLFVVVASLIGLILCLRR